MDTPTSKKRTSSDASEVSIPIRKTPRTERKSFWKKTVVFIQTVLLLVMTGLAGYFYYQYHKKPQVAAQQEIEALVAKIGELMELPDNEAPTLATVTNKEKLDDQPFFRRAQNGDKILIYKENGRAILYRPDTGKIIDTTTVNIEPDKAATTDESTTPSETVESEATVTEETPVSTEKPVISEDVLPVSDKTNVPLSARIALYNGSTTGGMTNKVGDSLIAKFPGIRITFKEKAAKNDYIGYKIIDLTGRNASEAQMLATELNGNLVPLPVGETINPGIADILVIVGNEP